MKDFGSLTQANQSQSQIDALQKIAKPINFVNGSRVITNGSDLSVFQGDLQNFKDAKIGGFNDEQLEMIFGALDVNGDGEIDEEEVTSFAAMGDGLNGVLDNHSSIIDQSDFQALYEMAQGYVDEALNDTDTDTTTTTTTADTTTDTTTTDTTSTANTNRTEPTLSDNQAIAVATELYGKVDGWTTYGEKQDIKAILLERGYNSADLVKIMNAYQEVNPNGVSLMQDIQGEFSGGDEDKLRETLFAASTQQAKEALGWTSTDDIPQDIMKKSSELYLGLSSGEWFADDNAMAEFDKYSPEEKAQIMVAMEMLYPDKSAMTRITDHVYWGKEDGYVQNILSSLNQVANSNQVADASNSTDTTATTDATSDTNVNKTESSISDNQAMAIATELYSDVDGWTTGEQKEHIKDVILNRGYNSADLVKIMNAYQQVNPNGISLMQDIQGEFSGDDETKMREALFAASNQQAQEALGWASTDDIPQDVMKKTSELYVALTSGEWFADDNAMAEFDKYSAKDKAQIMVAMQMLYPDKSAMTRITDHAYWGKEDGYVQNIIKSLNYVANSVQ
ncbi:hypothetical protein IJG14_07155 [bacterium]|nr:hypothetical protein [bacterium]